MAASTSTDRIKRVIQKSIWLPLVDLFELFFSSRPPTCAAFSIIPGLIDTMARRLALGGDRVCYRASARVETVRSSVRSRPAVSDRDRLLGQQFVWVYGLAQGPTDWLSSLAVSYGSRTAAPSAMRSQASRQASRSSCWNPTMSFTSFCSIAAPCDKAQIDRAVGRYEDGSPPYIPARAACTTNSRAGSPGVTRCRNPDPKRSRYSKGRSAAKSR